MEKKFKCKDEVIYRFKGGAGLGDPDPWIYGIFSHYKNNGDIVVNGNCHRANLTEILPYEGHEELVGTTDEPDEEVRLEEGEFIVCFDSLPQGFFDNFIDYRVRQFLYITCEYKFFTCDSRSWSYAIRFSDFNPNDMEETKKHILCVKNGKIVKYKG